MKILVTGARGFVGKNLCAQLNNIKEGKARWYEDVQADEVFEYDLGNTQEELDHFCSEADFVFNLAGVNRPQNQEEFMQGNFGFVSTLLATLKAHKTPVLLCFHPQLKPLSSVALVIQSMVAPRRQAKTCSFSTDKK